MARSLTSIAQRLQESDVFQELRSWSRETGPAAALHAKGLVGSLPAFLIEHLHADVVGPLVCLLGEDDSAAYLHSDLQQLGLEDGTDVLLFSGTKRTPYDREQITDTEPIIRRADVLQHLADGFDGVLVTSVEAIFELVPPLEEVRKETVTVAIGEEHAPEALVERMVQQGFTRVEFAEAPGELALRGGILDVYPFSGDYPLRIEFFGDEIDSIREFDPSTQRSVSNRTTARIVPNLENGKGKKGNHRLLLDFLPKSSLMVTFDEDRFHEQIQTMYERAEKAYEQAAAENGDLPLPSSRYLDEEGLARALLTRGRLVLGSFAGAMADEEYTFDARPQPPFNSNMKLLRQQIRENHTRQTDTIILCDSTGQRDRLHALLEELVEGGQIELIVESLHEGFEVPALGLAVYTDHQIFNRYHRPTARKQRKRSGGLTLRQIQDLDPGDYVVHIDYGIGKFAGLRKITVRGKQQEAVRLFFRDDDTLYVNVNALYKLHKYTGKEGYQPALTKLGSGQWERTKARTKKKVKDIARDLIKLYAERKASAGNAFSSDSVWQQEMEASFEFEDTPDQASAADAVKRDMEEPVPMDRLVCGDVGFGKTEVAVRAAFKAVQDGKQVAVLVPTTILASQHHETFNRRLERFPVKVELLSRFRTTSEQKAVIAGLKDGTVDIVIGTHRLTSNDVDFKNLGLLIIDEEQRFGVRVKEKLRKLRVDVDTLALTATPIPRTLQFSLLGARDLSIIGTPPPNRQPIITEIHSFDRDLIRDAILYEVNRGGQVFFIHNRVRSIDGVAEMIRAMVPDVRIKVGHGQMQPRRLEKVMLDFVEHRVDVLVSTTIIENGLDISNANTMIINHAERFGLSELHQLRGRVGRSQRKAFCYLLVPSVHALTREARQRLQAVEEFSDLGSGFSIAMRDLDIRGAGDLLGAEQSGFIQDVGYETYHRILDEAVQELRSDEFADVFDEEAVPPGPDTTVDVEEDAYIPEDYVANNVERLNLYRRLSEAGDEGALEALREEFADRFGPIPREVDHLLLAAELKLRARPLRLPKVVFKNERLFLYFPTEGTDDYFYDHLFHSFLERLSQLERRFVLKESKKGTLRAIVQDVPDLQAAKGVVEQLRAEEKMPA